jgi:hypothetical protein
MKPFGSIFCITKNFKNLNNGGDPILTEHINCIVKNTTNRDDKENSEISTYTVEIITDLQDYLLTGKTSGIIRTFNKHEINSIETIRIGYPNT